MHGCIMGIVFIAGSSFRLLQSCIYMLNEEMIDWLWKLGEQGCCLLYLV